MQGLLFTLFLLFFAAVAYRVGRRRAFAVSGGQIQRLHSLPRYYGLYVALWCALPALAVLAVWLIFEPMVLRAIVMANLPPDLTQDSPAHLNLLYNDIRNVASGAFAGRDGSPAVQAAAAHYNEVKRIVSMAMAVLGLLLAGAGFAAAARLVSPRLKAREFVEKIARIALIASSTIAVFTTLGIVLSLLFEAIRFFAAVPITEFLFGVEWSPQTAIRADQVGSSGAFGAVPLFAGTFLVSLIAMLVAAPIGLMSAIYMSEYAQPRVRGAIKPILEILAGVPTVVYGFFAALTVAPVIREFGGGVLGLDVSSESALAAGGVMGIMIIPFISSLSDDALTAVPGSLREGAYGLGATHSEMIRQVLLPAALPGIVGGLLLGVSRAIGETMIVVMAAGLAANLTANPLQAVTTVTVQIVTLLTGDQEFDSPKTLAAFALGLVLFFATLLLNVLALYIVRRYREQYE
jgi:phosphate transport system permease protein